MCLSVFSGKSRLIHHFPCNHLIEHPGSSELIRDFIGIKALIKILACNNCAIDWSQICHRILIRLAEDFIGCLLKNLKATLQSCLFLFTSWRFYHWNICNRLVYHYLLHLKESVSCSSESLSSLLYSFGLFLLFLRRDVRLSLNLNQGHLTLASLLNPEVTRLIKAWEALIECLRHAIDHHGFACGAVMMRLVERDVHSCCFTFRIKFLRKL